MRGHNPRAGCRSPSTSAPTSSPKDAIKRDDEEPDIKREPANSQALEIARLRRTRVIPHQLVLIVAKRYQRLGNLSTAFLRSGTQSRQQATLSRRAEWPKGRKSRMAERPQAPKSRRATRRKAQAQPAHPDALTDPATNRQIYGPAHLDVPPTRDELKRPAAIRWGITTSRPLHSPHEQTRRILVLIPPLRRRMVVGGAGWRHLHCLHREHDRHRIRHLRGPTRRKYVGLLSTLGAHDPPHPASL